MVRRFEYLLSDTGVSLEEATEGRYVLFREHEAALSAARAEALKEARQWKARAEAAEKRVKKLTAGLQVLATTFYKDDQHQAYAKHILDAARAALEAKP